MLERGDILTTFRLEQPPRVALNHAVRAVKIFDHPPRFLTYEGPVQKGTGKVRIVDRGTYALLTEAETAITMDLQGEVLQGGFTLAWMEGTTWQLISRPSDCHASRA
jgi:hypothetical protein